MKCLSLWQPWSSLIAIGVKSIETRGWSTCYRGPLAIHAAKRGMCMVGVELLMKVGASPLNSILATSKTCGLPLGAIIATCELVDVVLIGEQFGWPCIREYPDEGNLPHQKGGLWLIGVNELTHGNPTPLSETERLCGDYAPGRCAWLLRDVKALAKPIPFRGRQKLFDVPDELVLSGMEETR